MSSPDLWVLPDSDEDVASFVGGLNSEGDSQDSEQDLRTKEAEDFVASYCQAFDSKKHAGLVDLVSPNVSFDWFGEEVHGPQPLQQFMAANIPDTRHLGVTVEPCPEDEVAAPLMSGSKRKRDESIPVLTPSPGTSKVLVRGKLLFSRAPGTLRKAQKEWRWERNFKLHMSYSSEASSPEHSPSTKWRVQQVVYERSSQCKRALFT